MPQPYLERHLLFRLHGHFGVVVADQYEFWSCGLRIHIGASTLDEARKVAFLAAVATTTNQFHISSYVGTPDNCWLDKLTAAYINSDGFYLGGDSQPTTTYNYPSPSKGLSNSGLPFSCARAFTLDTDIERGVGSKGRFYYPCAHAVGSDGRWTATQAGQAAGAAKTFIDGVNTAAEATWGSDTYVAVFGTRKGMDIGEVIRVGVGRAPDTQRRRDNKLLEQHYYETTAAYEARRGLNDTRVYE